MSIQHVIRVAESFSMQPVGDISPGGARVQYQWCVQDRMTDWPVLEAALELFVKWILAGFVWME